jgi:hypothetical protein
MSGLAVGDGGDLPESQLTALYQAATATLLRNQIPVNNANKLDARTSWIEPLCGCNPARSYELDLISNGSCATLPIEKGTERHLPTHQPAYDYRSWTFRAR